MSIDSALPSDPGSLIRSRPYRVLLVLAALIGIVVSAASWGFLELVSVIQQWVYEDIPDAFGYDVAPSWWPLPWLALAGLLTAFAVERLPGRGGALPAPGGKAGRRPGRSSSRASSSRRPRRSVSGSCSAPRRP
jgi:hypothetical protein